MTITQLLQFHRHRVPGLSYDVLCVILGSAVLVELRLVTDGQHDNGVIDDTTMTAYTALVWRLAVKTITSAAASNRGNDSSSFYEHCVRIEFGGKKPQVCLRYLTGSPTYRRTRPTS